MESVGKSKDEVAKVCQRGAAKEISIEIETDSSKIGRTA